MGKVMTLLISIKSFTLFIDFYKLNINERDKKNYRMLFYIFDLQFLLIFLIFELINYCKFFGQIFKKTFFIFPSYTLFWYSNNISDKKIKLEYVRKIFINFNYIMFLRRYIKFLKIFLLDYKINIFKNYFIRSFNTLKFFGDKYG